MAKPPFVHVLSDLHLIRPDEAFYQAFLKFTADVPAPGDHLALAGDIFDVFVGNKDVFRRLHEPFFAAIRAALDRGVHVHHIEGNHDFWLLGAYQDSGCAGANVQGDFVEIDCDGRRLRVEHGDLADRSDRFYLVLRSFFRSTLGRSLITSAPGSILDSAGQLWSGTSRDMKKIPDDWSERDREKLRKIFFDYASTRVAPGLADALVMGHCHDPHQCPGYMNVGFPRRHRSWVRWSAAAGLERVDWKF